MISHKKNRLAPMAFATVMGIVCSSSSDAGRSVRSDSGDGSFDTLGGFWGQDTELSDSDPPDGGVDGLTQFKLNFGNGARFYRFCMSEDGFVRFVTSNACDQSVYALPPAGNYIAVFATELDSSFITGAGVLTRTRGFVDSKAPFRLWQAVPTMRFWWNGVALANDYPTNPNCVIDVQVVLLDRSKGTNNGDFDVELNYGTGSDPTPPDGCSGNGFRRLKLGPNATPQKFGPFDAFPTDGTPITFCFRGGQLRATCPQ